MRETCSQNDECLIGEGNEGDRLDRMKYQKIIILKDGRECLLRNGRAEDGREALEAFNLAHEETDYLLTYTDEKSFTAEEESRYLEAKTESEDGIEILAVIDGEIAGLAGIDSLGRKVKIRHRAGFGISILKKYWCLGIGRAMVEACIECAKKAGYEQLELDVVAENTRAIVLYEHCGFTIYGRNPKGFKSRYTGYQEVVYMRLEL